MSQEIEITNFDWQNCLERLQLHFERSIPAKFVVGKIELENLLNFLTPKQEDLVCRGRVVIGTQFCVALASVLQQPEKKITTESQMRVLLPNPTRKAIWRALQSQLEWKLPGIGLPIWAQYIWGAALLSGILMMFIWPIWGTSLFFGGIILSFQVEKIAWGLPYPTVGKTIDAMVRINWPSLEMGEAGNDHLRLIFADILTSNLFIDMDPRMPFPSIHVLESIERANRPAN